MRKQHRESEEEVQPNGTADNHEQNRKIHKQNWSLHLYFTDLHGPHFHALPSQCARLLRIVMSLYVGIALQLQAEDG